MIQISDISHTLFYSDISSFSSKSLKIKRRAQIAKIVVPMSANGCAIWIPRMPMAGVRNRSSGIRNHPCLAVETTVAQVPYPMDCGVILPITVIPMSGSVQSCRRRAQGTDPDHIHIILAEYCHNIAGKYQADHGKYKKNSCADLNAEHTGLFTRLYMPAPKQ